MKYIPLYLLVLAIFAVIDYMWITKIGWPTYQRGIGHLFADTFKAAPAIVFYLLYLVGMFYFAIIPGLEAQSVKVALLNGAFLGFIAYATYDLTNMATLKDWPLYITVVDMAWGTVLTGAVSTLAVYVGSTFRVLI